MKNSREIIVAGPPIIFSLSTVMGRIVIKMIAGQEEFIMLTVRKNQMIREFVSELQELFGIRVVTGMAFEYGRSVASSLLCSHPDELVIGIYVLSVDFQALPELRQLFGQ